LNHDLTFLIAVYYWEHLLHWSLLALSKERNGARHRFDYFPFPFSSNLKFLSYQSKFPVPPIFLFIFLVRLVLHVRPVRKVRLSLFSLAPPTMNFPHTFRPQLYPQFPFFKPHFLLAFSPKLWYNLHSCEVHFFTRERSLQS